MRIERYITYLSARTCGKWLVLLVGLTAGHFHLPVDAPAADEVKAHLDDQWRRTTTGWENIATWDSPLFVERSEAETLRWDSHPAGLALVQLLAVVLAFAAFPPLAAAASRRNSPQQAAHAV